LRIQGCTIVHVLAATIAAVPDTEENMVMGSAEFYSFLLQHAGHPYITGIDAVLTGDTWFSKSDRCLWHTVSCEAHQPDKPNAYPHIFTILEQSR
jgi:dihydrofolate reductase